MEQVRVLGSPIRDLVADAVQIQLPAGERRRLTGELGVPVGAQGLVVFAHGSGSSRRSPRNQAVARVLRGRGLATLLVDLLTPHEELQDLMQPCLRFDIDLLARRIGAVAEWVAQHRGLRSLSLGLFGASSGAAAALIAAANRPDHVAAVVSRGGRTDMAASVLPSVIAPTLLLVGSCDGEVVQINETARTTMSCPVSLEVIDGATHLFSESGALNQVAARAADWFVRYLGVPPHQRAWCRHGTC